MASILESARYLKRAALMNFSANNDLYITIMLNGQHGIGKSQVIKQVAKDLGGYFFIIDGSTLAEGDISGLPLVHTNEDNSKEVRFIKHEVLSKIARLEKQYYMKATRNGFLNGTVKLEELEDGTQYLIYDDKKVLIRNPIDRIEAGEENRYKFGEQLPGDIKLKLIESGEVKPGILFIDELNRAENQTMKQLMNFLLNKTMNGYDLPWWVNICAAVNPCSQNSTYSTNELDPAQLDRFLKIRVNAKLDDWINYALEKNMNSKVISGVAMSEEIFMRKKNEEQDTSEMEPSPRSWEIVAMMFDNIYKTNIPKFFSADDRKEVDNDLRVLVRGKVGENAARILFVNISDKDNNIEPKEILSGEEPTINKDVMKKFNNAKRLTQKVITDNVVIYLGGIIEKITKEKDGNNPKAKSYYTNIMSQLKEFVSSLDPATLAIFVKKIIAGTPDIEGIKFFKLTSTAYSAEALKVIEESRKGMSDLFNSK